MLIHEDYGLVGIYDPGFCDSGAYTLKSLGQMTHLPIEEYCQFLSVNHKRFEVIAFPDSIDDPDENERNFWQFMEGVEKYNIPKEKILGVWHLRTFSTKEFERSVNNCYKAGLSRLAVGGVTGIVKEGYTNEMKWSILDHIFGKSNYPEVRRDFKVHFFAITDPKYVYAFRPDSVDSARYINLSNNLDAWTCKVEMGYPKLVHKNLQHLTDKEFANYFWERMEPYREQLTEINENYGKEKYFKLITQKSSRVYPVMAMNILAIGEFERQVSKTYPFKYWASTPGYIMTAELEVNRIFHWALRERSLYTFAYYINSSPSSRTKHYNMYRMEDS